MQYGEIDHLSESADQRGEEILGALYDYVEMIAPSRD
jgi:exodeoxyribonuclease-1